MGYNHSCQYTGKKLTSKHFVLLSMFHCSSNKLKKRECSECRFFFLSMIVGSYHRHDVWMPLEVGLTQLPFDCGGWCATAGQHYSGYASELATGRQYPYPCRQRRHREIHSLLCTSSYDAVSACVVEFILFLCACDVGACKRKTLRKGGINNYRR